MVDPAAPEKCVEASIAQQDLHLKATSSSTDKTPTQMI
jgi:hypothetical protein